MVERPAPFTTGNVRSILAGTKTHTRRLIPEKYLDGNMINADHAIDILNRVGDHLWVRETHCPVELTPDGMNCIYKANYPDEYTKEQLDIEKWKPPRFMFKKYARIWLEITKVKIENLQDISEEDAIAEGIEIRHKQLGEEVDFYGHVDNAGNYLKFKNYQFKSGETHPFHYPKHSFQTLWDSINDKSGHGWETNPLVMVYEFKRIFKEE